MAKADIPPSLQESILATLAFNAEWGGVIAGQVTADNFDGQFRDVAERVLDYWVEFNKPPGRTHLDDLFAQLLVSQGRDRASPIRRVLVNLGALEEGLNGEYVAKQATYFVRQQELKVALITAGERFSQGGAEVVEDVEVILDKALRAEGVASFDLGTRLDDPRGLSFLEKRDSGVPLGVDQLDYAGVAFNPKETMLYIGPTKSGKTWFCVHSGKQGLLHSQRVLHISLEVSEEVMAARYYAAIFAVAKRKERVPITELEFNKARQLIGFRRTHRIPKLSYDSPDIRRELRAKIKPWGLRLGRIIVKQFPTRGLSVSRLWHYMDWLERAKHFIPTMLIVDYPDLMEVDKNNYRLSLGITFADLRGGCVERNLSGVFPTQGNRGSMTAKKVSASGVAEDISKVFTADTVLTYSQTAAEKRLNLARLRLDVARNIEGGMDVLISQAYGLGQYVVQSAYMSSDYWDRLKQETHSEDDNDDGDAEEEERG